MTPEEEAFLASYMARPEWKRARKLLAELLKADMKPLDRLIAKVRKNLWRDFSAPD